MPGRQVLPAWSARSALRHTPRPITIPSSRLDRTGPLLLAKLGDKSYHMKDRWDLFYGSDYRSSAHLNYIVVRPKDGDIVVFVLEEREVPGMPAPPNITETKTLTRASLRLDKCGLLLTAARDPTLVKHLMWDGALLRMNDLPAGWTVTIVYPMGVHLPGGLSLLIMSMTLKAGLTGSARRALAEDAVSVDVADDTPEHLGCQVWPARSARASIAGTLLV